MVTAARQWASSHGIRNAELRTIRHEAELGVEPASFDAATCRAGLQYMPDRDAAARKTSSVNK